MSTVLQVLGALAILFPYVGAQVGAIKLRSFPYLGLNLLGSTLLTVLAIAGRQWGFVLLEACWALVSAHGLGAQLRSGRGRSPSIPGS